MTDNIGKDDVVIDVKLPIKDYLIMRDLIDERQAMNGVKKWFQNNVLWFVSGLLSILGLFAYFKGIGQ